MKLLSCHIENFGAIHQADYKFDGALTAICERNGYGKTTLASFLKAMFYGMDSDRANSLFNDRRHFCPFTGGKFGGSVTFEAGGATYKIERFFDAKSEPKDTIVVYRNNTPVPCGGAPGQEFFGIDKESFERTAYISGADVKILSTGNIHQKLNHFVEGDQSDLDYEAAKARLQAKIKTYQKTRGGGGSISDATRRLNDLSAQISDKRAIEENLPQKYAELCTRNEEIAALTLRITAAQSENVLLANWESYDHMCAEIAKERQQLGAIEEQFPFGIPSLRETEQVQNALVLRQCR